MVRDPNGDAPPKYMKSDKMWYWQTIKPRHGMVGLDFNFRINKLHGGIRSYSVLCIGLSHNPLRLHIMGNTYFTVCWFLQIFSTRLPFQYDVECLS